MSSDVTVLMTNLSGQHFIDGVLVAGEGPTTPVIDPATEQICAVFAEATTAEIDTAVAAAMRAQRAWWALSALERTEALHEVATALAEVAPLVGEVMTREMGKPFVESNWEGGTSASSLRYYAELARHDQGRVAGAALPGQTHLTLKEPLGTWFQSCHSTFRCCCSAGRPPRRWLRATP